MITAGSPPAASDDVALGAATMRAAQLGVLPEPAVPLAAILLAVPATLVVANLIAAAPGQAAARTQPAAVLKTE